MIGLCASLGFTLYSKRNKTYSVVGTMHNTLPQQHYVYSILFTVRFGLNASLVGWIEAVKSSALLTQKKALIPFSAVNINQYYRPCVYETYSRPTKFLFLKMHAVAMGVSEPHSAPLYHSFYSHQCPFMDSMCYSHIDANSIRFDCVQWFCACLCVSVCTVYSVHFQ